MVACPGPPESVPILRVITARGAKPCRRLSNSNLLLNFLGSGHFTWAYMYCTRKCDEKEWTYFCRFVFVCFNLLKKNFINKLKFNDFLKIIKINIIH